MFGERIMRPGVPLPLTFWVCQFASVVGWMAHSHPACCDAALNPSPCCLSGNWMLCELSSLSTQGTEPPVDLLEHHRLQLQAFVRTARAWISTTR